MDSICIYEGISNKVFQYMMICSLIYVCFNFEFEFCIDVMGSEEFDSGLE